MTDLFAAIGGPFENTIVIFLDSIKCKKYINDQNFSGIDDDCEWKMYMLKEGVPFDAKFVFDVI